MSRTYDLTEEGWIPCVMADGSERLLGLREALVRAHEIREVYDDSPLVTAAVHRLLLAILHRVFGPPSEDDWTEMWRAGRFDDTAVSAYLAEWRERFDLFHPKRPFYQVAGLNEIMKPTSIAKLAPDLASGNNPAWFTHHMDGQPPGIEPGRAARWLVASQTFWVGGLVSRGPGEPKSAKGAPLTKAAVVIAVGDSLFETLMSNLVLYCPSGPDKHPFEDQREADAPAWERDEPAKLEEARPLGYLDYLTWQSRRLWLEPPDQDGRVRHAIVAAGRALPEGWMEDHEQMAAFRVSAKGGRQVVGVSADRAFWRDSLALFQSAAQGTEGYQRPAVLNHLGKLVERDVLPLSRVMRVWVVGQYTDRAKVSLWQWHRLPLPLRLLADEELVEILANAIGAAEGVGAGLGKALNKIAELLVSERAGRAAADQQAKRREAFPTMPYYWSELERHFYSFLAALGEDGCHADELLDRWFDAVKKTAYQALELTLRILPDSHAMLQRGAEASAELRRTIQQVIGG